MAKKTANPLIDAGRQLLQDAWDTLEDASQSGSGVPSQIIEAIKRSINSKTLTYRYVLPTQLLAKAVDSSMDCRAIQAGASLAGAFDARSLCHSVVVEFDRLNHNVLGGSKEPYLNNPLRIPAITKKAREAQKDKEGFDDLRTVLEFTEKNPKMANELFQLTLSFIKSRLESVAIVYPVPNRISLQQSQEILEEYFASRSGGVRLQAVAVALFRTIGRRFRLFAEIRSANVNAADAQTGIAADLECVTESGEVVFVVEVKDRQLTLHQMQDKLPSIREKGIREILFLVQGGVVQENVDSIKASVGQEFVTGQNIYICEFHDFLKACLVLFGEVGRREFLLLVGEELDRLRAPLQHRQEWCRLLKQL
ncbi:MAG: restriction endonuclease, SacI family [Gemmataceae bacterium]|nr:restriction endonuclease, SacI family [Gemmataceae bacterium]